MANRSTVKSPPPLSPLQLQGIRVTRMGLGKQSTPSALCWCIRSTKAIRSTEDTGSTRVLDEPKNDLYKMGLYIQPFSHRIAESPASPFIQTHLTSAVTPTSCQFTPPEGLQAYCSKSRYPKGRNSGRTA